MKPEVGAYEAKTKLPELLRQVQRGKRFTITNRGTAIAELVPSGSHDQNSKAASIERLREFMRADPVSGVDIKALIEAGRK